MNMSIYDTNVAAISTVVNVHCTVFIFYNYTDRLILHTFGVLHLYLKAKACSANKYNALFLQ